MPEKIIDQLRGEAKAYVKAKLTELIKLPITRDGFEALAERTAKELAIELDDGVRTTLVNFIHHLDTFVSTTTLEELTAVVHKAIANSTSWIIDQEIKIKQAAARELAEVKAKEEATTTEAAKVETQETPSN